MLKGELPWIFFCSGSRSLFLSLFLSLSLSLSLSLYLSFFFALPLYVRLSLLTVQLIRAPSRSIFPFLCVFVCSATFPFQFLRILLKLIDSFYYVYFV